MTYINFKGMFKDLEDKSRGLEKTMLMFIESINTLPEIIATMQGLEKLPDNIDGEYKRWQAISKTDMQKVFMCLRRSIAECQVSLEKSVLNNRSDE